MTVLRFEIILHCRKFTNLYYKWTFLTLSQMVQAYEDIPYLPQYDSCSQS